MPKLGDLINIGGSNGRLYKFSTESIYDSNSTEVLVGRGHINFKQTWTNHLFTTGYFDSIGASVSNFSTNNLLQFITARRLQFGAPIYNLCSRAQYHEIIDYQLNNPALSPFMFNNIDLSEPAHKNSQGMALADDVVKVLVMEGGYPYIYDAAGDKSLTPINIDENIAELFIISFAVGYLDYPSPNIQDAEGDVPNSVFGRGVDNNYLWSSFIEFSVDFLESYPAEVEEQEYILKYNNGWQLSGLPFDISTVSKIEHMYLEEDGSYTVNDTKTNFNYFDVTEYGETYQSMILSEFFEYSTSLDDIVIMKNYNGEVFLPEYGFDSIPHISKFEGYLFKFSVNQDFYLRVTAKPYYREVGDNNEPEYYIEIPVPEGWYIMNWPWVESADIEAVTQANTDNIIILKDNNGNAYLPEYGFNGIGSFKGGEGYLIKSNAAHTIKIPRPL